MTRTPGSERPPISVAKSDRHAQYEHNLLRRHEATLFPQTMLAVRYLGGVGGLGRLLGGGCSAQRMVSAGEVILVRAR